MNERTYIRSYVPDREWEREKYVQDHRRGKVSLPARPDMFVTWDDLLRKYQSRLLRALCVPASALASAGTTRRSDTLAQRAFSAFRRIFPAIVARQLASVNPIVVDDDE